MKERGSSTDQPHVTDDDMLLAAMLSSPEARWHDIAHDQPELARELEQSANRIRQLIEQGEILPVDVQQEIINLGTFIMSAIARARQRTAELNTQPEAPSATAQ